MKMKVFYGFALILLAFASWLFEGFFWGFPGSGWQCVRLIAFLLFVSGLALAFKRMSARVRIYTGLLILAGLFLPTSMIVAHPSFYLPQPFQALLPTTLFFMPSLALVIAALLLHSGINRYQSWREAGTVEDGGPPAQRKQAGRAAAVPLILSVLLLTKTLHNLYWLTVWDNANDSLEYFLLVVPVVAVLFSAVMLSITLPGRTKWTGPLYAMFILASMVAVFARAQQVDFRQLTEERADQVSQAIETYYAQAGHYPQDLRQLTPWTILTIPGPVIIYGQGWCYEAGVDYYRLGYIYRDHWSSPILTGRIYKTKGQALDLSHLCDAEIAALRKRYPDYPWEYSMNGE
jgi:hypothetical protein